jgi:hypothetical protein
MYIRLLVCEYQTPDKAMPNENEYPNRPIKQVLVTNLIINITDKKTCAVRLNESGTTYYLVFHRKKDIRKILKVLNTDDENSIYNTKLELAKRILLHNDVFFDKIEIL